MPDKQSAFSGDCGCIIPDVPFACSAPGCRQPCNTNHYGARTPSTWTDADKARHLADGIGTNGIGSATGTEPWKADIIVRALRAFATMLETEANKHV